MQDTGRITWIVGAAGGIGEAISKDLATDVSRRLCLVDRKKRYHLKTDSDKCQCWHLDASDSEEVQRFAKQARSLVGPPVDLVLTAGLVVSKRLEKSTCREFDMLYRDNLRLPLVICKQFFDDCDKSRSIQKNIILLTSNAGVIARPHQVAYACMKAAVASLVSSLAAAWGRFGIRVNGIAPGTVVVPRNRNALKRAFPDLPLDDTRPSGRLAEPKDVANTVRFLLSHESAQITGHVIVVDGGNSLQVRQ